MHFGWAVWHYINILFSFLKSETQSTAYIYTHLLSNEKIFGLACFNDLPLRFLHRFVAFGPG